MDERFEIKNGLLMMKSAENQMDIMEEEILVDPILDTPSKLNTIEVEALLDDPFANNDVISKQIIVEKMDDIIGESEFEELNIINSHPLHAQEFHSKNIAIIPEEFCNSVGKTHKIINYETEVDPGGFFQDNQTTGNYDVMLESVDEQDPDAVPVIHLKKETLESQLDSLDHGNEDHKLPGKPVTKVAASSTSSTQASKPKLSKATKERERIKIDKDDPRCRLHFVKFMKKDGKTIKIWECGICGKEFIHQYTLMRHLPTHTDERNFKCQHCGKAFRQMSTLAQHSATHSEFRPYVCDVCKKTFSRVSTLISHKKIHAEQKPHICNICGKGFHQKGNLKNHFFTHTNERPYKCEVCGRGFNQSSNLQCHRLKAHFSNRPDGNGMIQLTNNKFKCSSCPEAFSRRAQLHQHEDYVHNIKNVFTYKGVIKPNINSPLISKKKLGDIRIIQMPPGSSSASNERKTGILIDPIDTKALHKTLSKGITPFALLKPATSSPVVVKVQLCDGSKHMLVPASAAELKSAGKFSVTSQVDGQKAVQIKIPVVATIHQRVDENGEVHMDVEPPSDEEEDAVNESVLEVDQPARQEGEEVDSVLPSLDSETVSSREKSPVVQHFILNTSMTKPLKETLITNYAEENELDNLPISIQTQPNDYLNSRQLIEVLPPEQEGDAHDISNAVSLTSQQVQIKDSLEVEPTIQYLRPTENFGEYEVVDNDDGSLFTNSQGVIHQIKPLIDESEPVTVDHSHLTALMNVLQTAGYELLTEDGSPAQQIILNSGDDSIIVDNQHVQVVINAEQNLNGVDVKNVQVDNDENDESSNLGFDVQNS